MVRAIFGINHACDFWKFWDYPRFTWVISKFSQMHSCNLSQIALSNMWLLVQIRYVLCLYCYIVAWLHILLLQEIVYLPTADLYGTKKCVHIPTFEFYKSCIGLKMQINIVNKWITYSNISLWITVAYYWGGSLTYLTLNTVLFKFCPEGHQKPCN